MEVTLDIDRYGIGIVTLDYPEKRNILSRPMMEQLERIVRDIYEQRSQVKALIIQSKHPAFFSAGGDVREWLQYEPLEAYQAAYQGGQLFSALENLPVLTIAAIGGICLGGGCELALACDIRICTKDATFGLPEVLLGNGTSWGGYYRLARTVGNPRAKEMILLGQTYAASEAKQFGLVHHIVSDFEQLHQAAYDMAKKASINRNTIAVSKLILNQIQNEMIPVNLVVDAHSAAFFAGTETSKLRKQAFLEKRLNALLESELIK